MGWVGEYHSPGAVPFDLLLRDRPDRLAGDAVEDIEHTHLAGVRDRLDRLAVDSDVHQQRRRRHVIVPDLVMDELEVPFRLAGVEIDGHQAVAVETGAGALAAIEIEVGDSTGRYARPASGSAVISVHTPVLPVYSLEFSSQVSAPGSPFCGMVRNCQRRLPVRTSKARAEPLLFLKLEGVKPSRKAEPTSTLSPTTVGRRLPADFAGGQVG